MPLSREDVLHIATLCRIGMTEEDLARAQDQLSHILEQFEALRQLDTENVPPTAQSLELQSVFRDDASKPSLHPGEVLANAPGAEAGHLRIKAVLED
jgi:aspartyl-tRNA(Asn)/glutamyl-tRNA(Gln) amidotransferase subunit C